MKRFKAPTTDGDLSHSLTLLKKTGKPATSVNRLQIVQIDFQQILGECGVRINPNFEVPMLPLLIVLMTQIQSEIVNTNNMVQAEHKKLEEALDVRYIKHNTDFQIISHCLRNLNQEVVEMLEKLMRAHMSKGGSFENFKKLANDERENALTTEVKRKSIDIIKEELWKIVN
jgi:hypothetical protein